MTPEQFIAEAKRRGKSKEETQRKYAELKAAGVFTSAPAPEQEPEKEDDLGALDTAVGAIQSFNQGTTLGWGDEIVARGRAGLDLATAALLGEEQGDQTWDERVEMFRQADEANRQQFAKENPKTAFGLELAGGFASPVNRIAPGYGTRGSAMRRLGESVARGGVEGAVAGAGAAGPENREEGMLSGAAWGGGAAGALTGVGGAVGRGLSKRRVEADLEQADGSFMPIHIADKEGFVGDLYRNTIGRAWGGKQALARQEAPYLEAARTKVDEVSDALERRADEVQDGLYQAREAMADTAASQKQQIANRTADAIDEASNAGAAAAAREAAGFRRQVAQESLPPSAQGALEGVDLDNPEAVRDVIGAWWVNNGFDVVKRNADGSERFFDFDDTLGRKIRDRLKEDPELRLEFGETIMPKLQEMQRRLMDEMPPGTELVPEDYIEAMLSGKYQIRGDALMAMRNVFASGANGRSKNGNRLRQIANEFDNFIRVNVTPAEAADFNENIARYTTGLTYMDVTRNKKVREAGGLFTPSQWMGASGKYGGRGMSVKRPPQEGLAKARNRRVADAEAAAKAAGPEVRKAATAANKAVDRNTRRQRAAIEREAREQKRAIRDEKTHGGLKRAKDELKTVESAAIPKNASGLSSLLTTATLGSVPGAGTGSLGFGVPVALGVGMGVARGLSTKGAQKAVAGQTAVQRELAAALRRGDTALATRILARERARESQE